MELSPLQRLAQTHLVNRGMTLEAFLLDRANLDVPASAIARQLREATSGEVNVTPQAVRNWIRSFRDRRGAAA